MKERALTSAETAMAKGIYQDSIDYAMVKIHDHKKNIFQPGNSGMTPNGEIYVSGVYKADYAVESGALKGFFIHEMAHVWQYQNKVLNVRGAAIAEFFEHLFQYSKAYPYTLDAAKDLVDYDIEQQASIIEDYFRITVAKLLPRFMQNTVTQGARDKLYAAVLAKFLKDPKYARKS